MNLTDLALKHGTDKAGHHNYTPLYEKYLSPFRFYDGLFFLLELGVGGYEYPKQGGESLRMWEDYFPHGLIVGVDVHPKKIKTRRAVVIQGSQEDPVWLHKLIDENGPPTVIIDDASHINSLTIKSFKNLFPLLASGGVYVVEDIESSWTAPDSWAQGMDLYYDYNAVSTVNFFRQLVDEVNQQYIPHYEARGFSDIASIHFHKNIIFILKK